MTTFARFSWDKAEPGAYATSLSPERRLELEARLRRRLLGGDADRSIELRARAWAAKGRVAAR